MEDLNAFPPFSSCDRRQNSYKYSKTNSVAVPSPLHARSHAHSAKVTADWPTYFPLLIVLLWAGSCSAEVKFHGGIENTTVTLGRDASLSCVVEGLGTHKVGWIHLKRQMIVAVHTRMITRISRYSVTHEDNKTWTLHIKGVREDDRGYYMCQVNTKPALSQVGYLGVVVPPTIVDEESSDSEIQVREKKNVTLRCRGRGRPAPRIMWRREDGEMIVPDDKSPVTKVDGEMLELSSVSRTHMGSYLCIASNNVPPSVSKRVTLKVEFAPQIHVPNQLIGVPTGDNVTIECHVEAFPKAISYWVRDKVMVMNDTKYKTETVKNLYKIDMRLTVINFTTDDSRVFKCVAKNSLGESEGDIKLSEIYTAPKVVEIRSNGEGDQTTLKPRVFIKNRKNMYSSSNRGGLGATDQSKGDKIQLIESNSIQSHGPFIPQSEGYPHTDNVGASEWGESNSFWDFPFTSGSTSLHSKVHLTSFLRKVFSLPSNYQAVPKENFVFYEVAGVTLTDFLPMLSFAQITALVIIVCFFYS